MQSDKPEADIRTLSNGTCQFWSLLTALGINELHRRIDQTFVSPDIIQVTSSIYDSIYGIALADVDVLKWLNDNLVDILVKDFMIDQTVHNEANLELGLDWSDLHSLDNNASLEDISQVLSILSEA